MPTQKKFWGKSRI
jgi:hypothetical protein